MLCLLLFVCLGACRPPLARICCAKSKGINQGWANYGLRAPAGEWGLGLALLRRSRRGTGLGAAPHSSWKPRHGSAPAPTHSNGPAPMGAVGAVPADKAVCRASWPHLCIGAREGTCHCLREPLEGGMGIAQCNPKDYGMKLTKEQM
uniref:Uncharacterized protein n=1 Tax=Chrysemys picta bellii TaxID=8478 RepID=A0A8C3IFA7_CHRPI